MDAIGYLCELPDAPPALALDAQRAAVLDACARLGVEARVPFADHAPGDRSTLRTLLARAHDGPATPSLLVVVADVAVLGAGVREQWLRVLQLAACDVDLRIADGRTTDAALTAAWAARGTADRRRERAIEGMRRRALRGEPLGRAPYGYRVEHADTAAGGRSRLVPDPGEAPIVRRIFTLSVEGGEGVRRIAAQLNADGVRTRRGGVWNMASVRDLLRNPVYTGLYRRLGVTIVGAHEPLVSPEQFRAAERRMAARQSRASGTRRRGEYPLSGIARCGYCGARLVGARRAAAGGGEHRYYRCGAATAQGRCAAHTRHADELEDAVLGEVARGVERAPLLDELAGPAAADATAGHARTLRRELDRMIERRATGQWTADQLARLAAPLALELLTIEEHAAHARTRPADAGASRALGAATRLARERLIADWPRLGDGDRRARLAEVVREVVVTDDAVRVALVR